jgi:transglutaminase-like putative cysteine protease
MKRILLLAAVSWFINAKAIDIKYPVSAIAEDLKKGVDIVVREDHMRFKIKSKSTATHYVHEALTIFNENGNASAKRTIFYDKLKKIVDINAYVYDASGKQIKRLRKSEIYDQAMFDGMTLFSDDRFKEIDLTQANYPYTVEFEYEIEYDYLFHIPSAWWGGERISHEHASYQLIYPEGLEPRYKLFNIQAEPKRENLEKGFRSIVWRFENLKPNKIESNGPSFEEIVPHIIVAPIDFEFEKYSGSMNSWNSFGAWIISLNKGRDILPDETKRKIKEITSGLKSNEEKVKALYEFMQNKTRYVSIQLGIGGYQPFEASVVDKFGYGDCKALSNYMIALLKEAGILANYVLIEAGQSPSMDEGFPSSQFNHAIAAVPNGKDTLWLECTSQTNPFGYQGKFTGDRKALMITNQGAVVVNTLKYSPEQNLQSRIAQIRIEETGNAVAKIKTMHKGIQYENDHLNWALSSQDKQKKWIEKNTEIPNFSINSFSMTEKKDKIPSATISLDLTLNHYASVSGKRLFMSPNLMNRNSFVPAKIEERKTDVVIRSAYLDLDTINYTLPENLYPEFLPEPVKINSKFGEYEASFKFDAGKVTYIRRMKVWKGRFPKETYNELVDFYKNVSKADNIKLVFLNKT